jgi:catenin alpha
MIEIAKQGDEKQLNECAQIFLDHSEKLLEVSSMACSMSNNVDGIKLVRMAAIQVQSLSSQVINAARILCSRTNSKVAMENMQVFRDSWHKTIYLLTDAVDDITGIHDFLAVSENHVLDDLNSCVMTMREQDADALDRTAGILRGRINRICNVVIGETDLYEPDELIHKILDTVAVLRDQIILNFARSVQYAVNALSSQPMQDPDDNGFIEASRLVYDGVHDVRNVVLMLSEQIYDNESDIEDNYGQDNNYNNAGNQSEQSYPVETEPEPLNDEQFKNFPEDQREQIQRQLESFRQEKKNFEQKSFQHYYYYSCFVITMMMMMM